MTRFKKFNLLDGPVRLSIFLPLFLFLANPVFCLNDISYSIESWALYRNQSIVYYYDFRSWQSGSLVYTIDLPPRDPVHTTVQEDFDIDAILKFRIDTTLFKSGLSVVTQVLKPGATDGSQYKIRITAPSGGYELHKIYTCNVAFLLTPMRARLAEIYNKESTNDFPTTLRFRMWLSYAKEDYEGGLFLSEKLEFPFEFRV